MSALLAEFNAYLAREGADPVADQVGYRQHALWLSPAELEELTGERSAQPSRRDSPTGRALSGHSTCSAQRAGAGHRHLHLPAHGETGRLAEHAAAPSPTGLTPAESKATIAQLWLDAGHFVHPDLPTP